MRSIIVICAIVLSFVVGSCNSERKQEKMWDTSVAADAHIIDTTAVADTAVRDTMYRNSPAKSDTTSKQ